MLCIDDLYQRNHSVEKANAPTNKHILTKIVCSRVQRVPIKRELQHVVSNYNIFINMNKIIEFCRINSTLNGNRITKLI